MATLSNPFYSSPIADAVANLAKVYMTGPTEAEKIKGAEQALKLKTERENTARVAELFGRYGQPGFDRNAVMSAAVAGGYSPQDLAVMERYGAANTFGATDQRTTNASVGAGGAYSGTAHGFRESEANTNARAANALAETKRQFDAKPYAAIGPDGQPVIMTNKTAVGAAPIMTDTEVKGTRANANWGNLDKLTPAQSNYIGADGKNPPAPKNYIHPSGVFLTSDGKTDVNGQPLPPGGYIGTVQGGAGDVGLTDPNRTRVQGSNMALDRLEKTVGYIGELSGDPTNFGAPGFIKEVSQGASQAIHGIAAGLGFDGLEEATSAVREKLAKGGVNPSIISGIFDPTLPKLNQAYALLLYQGAEALAGQSGRAVTDADIRRMQSIVGDPQSFWSSQATMAERINGLNRFIADTRAVNNKYMPGTSSAPSSTAPPAGGAATPKKVFIRDANGNLVRSQ